MSNGVKPAAPDGRRHVPVLLERCVELLAPALDHPGSIVVDATLGMGGHAEALLSRCPQAALIGIDRDPQALEIAGRRLAGFGERVELVHAVHDRMVEVLRGRGLTQVDAVLLDLGVSSLQLDEVDRGFSYSADAPLDMRMDPSAELTAADVLNTYSVADLTRVLRDYGEERFARRIAQEVVRQRQREPFSRSERLVDVVRSSIPAPARRHGGHPAKRTFQALRIEVNAELDTLAAVIPAALRQLAVGGRMVVMSYHSLEDRIVKRAFAEGARNSGSAGPARRATRACALAAAADPRGRGRRRARGRSQPTGRVGAPARRRTDPSRRTHPPRQGERRMSAATARATRATPRPAGPGAARSRRTGLQLVQAPHRLRSRAALVSVSIVALSLGLVALLVLAVSLQRGAYEMRALRAQTLALTEQEQALSESIAVLQAPRALSAQARELGMVPAANVAVIRISDGAVLGEAAPATRPPQIRTAVPAARPSAPAKPAAEPATKPAAEPATKPAAEPATKPAAEPREA